MNTSPACICGAPPGGLRRLARPVFGDRALFSCGSCGTVQLFPPPRHEGSIEAIYQDSTYLSKIPRAEYFGYFKVFENYLRVDMGLSKDVSLLDFGAGWCQYQKFFLEEGYQCVHSLEINKHLVAQARLKLGLDNVYEKTEDLRPGSYDVVLSNQVFEHLLNPLETLERVIFPLLKPNGVVCFSVPNWRALNRPILGKKWLGYSPEDHIWFFSEQSVRYLLSASTSFSIVEILVRSAVGKEYDGFKPNTLIKRIYYNTIWRVAEMIGRGDQLIVTLRRRP